MADYMKEEIEARTDGDVSVTVYTIGQLGTQLDMIENTSLGAIDMVVQITTNAVSIVPDFQIFNFFYLFEDLDAYNAVIDPDGDLFAHFEQEIADKLNSRLYTFASGGNRILSNQLRPVEGPADLDGMKMRASAPLTQNQWAEFGMTSFPVSFGEQYTALQTGLIEATENSVSATFGNKIPEVAPYIALTNHEIMTIFVMASDIAMNRLPQEYQDIVAEVGQEAGAIGTAAAVELDQSVLEELRAFPGATVTEPDTTAFASRLVPLHDTLAEDLGLTDLLGAAREAMGGNGS
jgi:TRAP-type C4-dicarboxylate transport system substrate-binding protein